MSKSAVLIVFSVVESFNAVCYKVETKRHNNSSDILAFSISVVTLIGSRSVFRGRRGTFWDTENAFLKFAFAYSADF